MSNSKPIGIFDSGLGGLTVVRALKKVLPNENIVYFGDTGRVPYGTRSQKTIERYAIQDEDFLISKNVKIIIAACGTVSSVAPHTGERLNVPFIGVVEPAARMAVSRSKNKTIGVIGTSATINSMAYENQIKLLCPEANVYSVACPLFVPLIEEGIVSSSPTLAEMAVKHYLSRFENSNIDTLILGCTHYPIIKDVIAAVMPEIQLIDIGTATAEYAAETMRNNNLLAENNTSAFCEYYVSDRIDGFAKQANLFLGKKIDNFIKHIELE